MAHAAAGADTVRPVMARTRAPAGLVLLCLLLGAVTLLIPAAPSYDPWSWLIWGREVVQGDLSTEVGPSWKPLPVLFTAPLSLVGEAAPHLWLVIARAATFGAAIAAALIGLRLAGRLGAVLAGGLLLSYTDLWQASLLGNSEGGLVLCLLGAAERHMAGRFGQAFAFGVAAGLLRPEAWPFLGLYAAWLVLREPRRLAWVAGGLALLPVLWLLPELWGSGSLWRGAERAQAVGPGSPALASRPALEVAKNALELAPAVVYLGVVAGIGAAAARAAPRAALPSTAGLSALGLAWLVLVAVVTEFGFSGIDRYLFPAVAIAHVVAGVGLAWALAKLAAPPRPGLRVVAAGLLALVASAAVIRAGSVDWAEAGPFVERHGDVTWELDSAIARAGGERRLEECGSITSSFLMVPPVAWTLERHLSEVTHKPRPPTVVLRARLRVDHPIDPHPLALAGEPDRTELARTEHWHVEAVCAASS